MSVLMSESFIHSFNQFIQTADSFRRSQLAVLMNGPLNQLTQSIHSNTWIRSETKHRCVLLRDTQQFCCGFDRNYFRMRN